MKTIHAYTTVSTPIAEGAQPPADIQWMPPGQQKITATGHGGEPFDLTIDVNAAVAETVIRAFNQMKADAAAGLGPLPYLDLNHDDREASGHPTEFFWAGSDPKTGGIRARVHWTDLGAASITGRRFRAFSPTFRVDDDGKVVGVTPNMGGLVNRPAFRSIQPIWSREGAGPSTKTHQPTHTMTDQEKQLADLTTAVTKLTDTVTAQAAELKEVKAKAAATPAAPAAPAVDAAKVDPKIIDLEKEVKALKDARTAEAKAIAERAVSAAAAAGKFPPQDKAMFDHLVTVYCASPEAGQSILDKMQVNPALVTIVNGKAVTTTGNGTDAEEFKKLVNAKAAELKGNKSAALDVAINEKPQLYQAWRDANGQPAL